MYCHNYWAHGQINPYLNSHCPIEMILTEKELFPKPEENAHTHEHKHMHKKEKQTNKQQKEKEKEKERCL